MPGAPPQSQANRGKSISRGGGERKRITAGRHLWLLKTGRNLWLLKTGRNLWLRLTLLNDDEDDVGSAPPPKIVLAGFRAILLSK